MKNTFTKGSYFIYGYTNQTEGYQCIMVNGYKFTKYGRDYGIKKEGTCWTITDIKSGLKVNMKRIKTMDECYSFITESMEKAISKAENGNQDQCKLINEAYKKHIEDTFNSCGC